VFCRDLGTNFALHNIKRLVFVTEVETVYCVVRTESLYTYVVIIIIIIIIITMFMKG